jgi:hypothetical protein
MHVECLLDEEGNTPAQDDDFILVANPPVNTATMEEDDLWPLLDKVLEGPTVRGHGGTHKFDWENNWLNTGSGVQISAISSWKNEGVIPGDWEKSLGELFLEDFLGKSWTRYICTTCGLDTL